VTSSGPRHLRSPDVESALARLATCVRSMRVELLQLRDSAGQQADYPSVVEQLSLWLYATWYSVPDPSADTPHTIFGRSHLVSALRAAVPACARWQREWVVVQSAPDGSCVAGKQGRTRQLRPGDYANLARPGMPVMPGDNIAVTELLSWVEEQKGFWCAQSLIGEPAPPLVRLYWSAAQDQIGFVLREVAGVLERLAIPYALKCPIRAVDYARVESLIVYLGGETWSGAASAVTETAEKAGVHLRESVPPLTLRIARGVAFAQDPGDGQSFGQSRCRALASGVLALLDGNWSPADALTVLVDALRAAGIDPDRPWQKGVA